MTGTEPRVGIGSGIAHMSVGGFHRAHQAVFVDELLERQPADWMIRGIGLLETDRGFVDAMNDQSCVYTLVERSGRRDEARTVRSIASMQHAPSDPVATVAALSDPDIRIVSLTITEKGYCTTSAGSLDFGHPMITADLEAPERPVSALGFITAAARNRERLGANPFTVMSCDNLPGNGDMTRRLVLELADAQDPHAAKWINEFVSFPNSMVDRITPAVSEETISFVRECFGIEDPCAVVSESFRQWVLEDEFCAGRPELESVGAQFVADVAPYEKCKVRLLNGSHSALAYVAYLMGHRQVDIAMRDPLVREFVTRYMAEVAPTVPPVPGIDVREYQRTLVDRFSNAAIADQVLRLAMDGSQKIRNAVVPPFIAQVERGAPVRFLAFALAGWFRFLRGVDEAGVAIEIVDPLADELTVRANAGGGDPRPLLGLADVFGTELGNSPTATAAVREALDAIDSLGTRTALARLLES